VICYLVKYVGVYQSLSKETKDTLHLAQSNFVDPASTSLDVDLQVFISLSFSSLIGKTYRSLILDCIQHTDFSLIPDAHISNTISKLVVRKNIIRNRINQCLRSMPRLNDLVAWIICRKGSALSYTFVDQFNHVLDYHAISAGDTRSKKTIQEVLSLIIQVCAVCAVFFHDLFVRIPLAYLYTSSSRVALRISRTKNRSSCSYRSGIPRNT